MNQLTSNAKSSAELKLENLEIMKMQAVAIMDQPKRIGGLKMSDLFRKKLQDQLHPGQQTVTVATKAIPRCLFGSPVTAENDDLMNRVYEVKAKSFNKRWNFNINNSNNENTTLPPTSSSEKIASAVDDQKFIWNEVINSEKSTSCVAPLFFAPIDNMETEDMSIPNHRQTEGCEKLIKTPYPELIMIQDTYPQSQFIEALEAETLLSPSSPMTSPESPLTTEHNYGTPPSSRIRRGVPSELQLDSNTKIAKIESPETVVTMDAVPSNSPTVQQTRFQFPPIQRQTYITDYCRSKKVGRAKKI